MRDFREWWLRQAQGLAVGQRTKVRHPQDGLDKTESVSIGHNETCYWAKCYRRGESDAVFKDVVNLTELAEAQLVSAKSDLPEDLEIYNPVGDWIHRMATDYLLKRNVDPAIVEGDTYISPSRMRLVFKETDTSGFTGYIGRDITEKHKAKAVNYYTDGGRLKNVVLSAFSSGAIVLVEDILSAEKVRSAVSPIRYPAGGLASQAISLNGTTGSASLTLACVDQDVVIWLDGDEAGVNGAIKLIKDLRLLSKSVKIVVGDKDPKEYTYTEIQEILWVVKCSNNVKIEISEVLK